MHANAPSPSHHESRRELETSITDVGCADLYKHTYFITRHDCVSEIEMYLQQGVLEEMCFDQPWPDPDAGNFISQNTFLVCIVVASWTCNCGYSQIHQQKCKDSGENAAVYFHSCQKGLTSFNCTCCSCQSMK